MKYVFSLMFVIVLCSSMNAVNCRAAVGLDAFGLLVISDQNLVAGYKETTAPMVSAQITESVECFDLGIGMNYQLPRDHGDLPEDMQVAYGEHYFFPIYGILSYNIPSTGRIKPQLISQFGYNFVSMKFPLNDEDDRDDINGGFFYGLGLGLDYHKISLNVMYLSNGMRVNHEELSSNHWRVTNEGDIQTQQLNISIGYKFGRAL